MPLQKKTQGSSNVPQIPHKQWSFFFLCQLISPFSSPYKSKPITSSMFKKGSNRVKRSSEPCSLDDGKQFASETCIIHMSYLSGVYIYIYIHMSCIIYINIYTAAYVAACISLSNVVEYRYWYVNHAFTFRSLDLQICRVFHLAVLWPVLSVWMSIPWAIGPCNCSVSANHMPRWASNRCGGSCIDDILHMASHWWIKVLFFMSACIIFVSWHSDAMLFAVFKGTKPSAVLSFAKTEGQNSVISMCFSPSLQAYTYPLSSHSFIILWLRNIWLLFTNLLSSYYFPRYLQQDPLNGPLNLQHPSFRG